jgi:hypothetical protein
MDCYASELGSVATGPDQALHRSQESLTVAGSCLNLQPIFLFGVPPSLLPEGRQPERAEAAIVLSTERGFVF